MSFSTISVQELAERLSQNQDKSTIQLVDVREPQELELAALPGFRRFSLSEFGQWGPQLGELLDPHKETIVLCHHGMRSAQMCGYLVEQGFSQVRNVRGGIDAYTQVDPTVPRY
ncbi:rhodanese-like domain-containing protein [Anthocerotibacter panamensis]|uniref:rhodanese-like domain-containing protein n=1 Tax=Anthocerotibacter panamensis TaxID=2857077 RepID=UPI001C402204|nr:rhodanese-like domain-containing protein [Anthocerotibacter panamensis]